MLRLTIAVRLAWWFPLYKWGLVTTVAFTGCEPDWEKVEATIKRAVRYRIVKES